MPRIYASNNDPIDLCADCFPAAEEEALELYGNLGNGPDGRGNCFAYDAIHPPYDSWVYQCGQCGKSLSDDID